MKPQSPNFLPKRDGRGYDTDKLIWVRQDSMSGVK